MDVNPKAPLIQFPFSTGIDESQLDAVVEAGSGWLALENGRQDQTGGYNTRNGFVSLTQSRLTGSPPSSGYRMFADRRSIARICNKTADSPIVDTYSPQAAIWVPQGRVCEADYRTIEIPGGTGSASVEDVEYCNGYVAVATQTAAGSVFTLYDEASGAVVLAPFTVVGGTTRPVLGSFSSRYIYMLYATSTTLVLALTDTQSSATLQLSLLTTYNVTTTTYAGKAIAICSLADRVAVAWINNNAGSLRVSVATYNETGLLETAAITTSAATPFGIDVACFGGTGTLFVGWNDTAAINVIGLTYNSLATVLATTATVVTTTGSVSEMVGISPSSATGGRVIANGGIDVDVRLHARGFTTNAGAVLATGGQNDIFGASFCSRPFFYSNRHYVQVFGGGSLYSVATGNTQKNLVLVDWTGNTPILRPVVSLTPELAVNAFWGKSKTVAGPTPTRLYGGASVTRSAQTNACTLIEYNFASNRQWQPAAFGNATYLSGGVLTCFTGARCAEVGFIHRPKAPLFVSAAGVGTINGTYRYVLAYEDLDAYGNWHISGLSAPSAVVTAANNTTLTMTGSPLAITQRVDSSGTIQTSNMAWYRTLAGAVAPYYRVGSTNNYAGSATATLSDTMTDAVLATKAKLYSQPGISGTSQDHRPPPGLAMVVAYSGMLVGATGSDVWYSAQNVSGEGAWFNPIFQIPIPGAGDITALAVMDGTLFVFKRSEIYAMAGEAPSDNGSSGGLGAPRRLSCDVGCIESRSTCTTAYGVFFQSDRGIEILTRAQTVEWIGLNIQQTTRSFPTGTHARPCRLSRRDRTGRNCAWSLLQGAPHFDPMPLGKVTCSSACVLKSALG